MGWDHVTQVLDALAPDASKTNFPVPTLLVSTGPGGTFTSEGPLLNGQNLPGQWLLTGSRKVHGWQVIQGNYLLGARLVPTADPVTEVTFAVKVWADADALTFRRMLRNGILSKPVITLKNPTNGFVSGFDTSTAVMTIEHPAVNDLSITRVVLASKTPLYNPLVSSGGKGPWTAEITFLEWPGDFRAAPPIPDQTISDPGAVTPNAFAGAQNAGAKVAQGDAARDSALAAQVGA
jgi:hypothetical protein